ncbi:MAG: PAS domain S-box protein, partial [Pirellulaceae bacterium]
MVRYWRHRFRADRTPRPVYTVVGFWLVAFLVISVVAVCFARVEQAHARIDQLFHTQSLITDVRIGLDKLRESAHRAHQGEPRLASHARDVGCKLLDRALPQLESSDICDAAAVGKLHDLAREAQTLASNAVQISQKAVAQQEQSHRPETAPFEAEVKNHLSRITELAAAAFQLGRQIDRDIRQQAAAEQNGMMWKNRGAVAMLLLGLTSLLVAVAYTRARNRSLQSLVEQLTVSRAEAAESMQRAEQSAIELRRSQERLQASESQLRAVLENAAEGIITFQEEGVIESCNAAALRMFDANQKCAAGRHVWELIPSLRLPAAYQAEGVPPFKLGTAREYTSFRDDGSQFPLEVTLSSFETDGRLFYTGILRDLTAQKKLQVELTHAQKLESVGHLAAGIAHEINTPTQFISDNVHFLSESFADLHRALRLYADLLDQARGRTVQDDLLDRIQQCLEEIDLETLEVEIPASIEQSLEGLSRVSSIVRAMKEFSHPGTDEKSPIDLNAAIDTSITVSRNEWKYVADMETDLDPELPPVPALPGEINQVLLN